MPSLLYPYLIGVISTVVVPLIALLSYISTHFKGREYDRLRERLPEAMDTLEKFEADIEMHGAVASFMGGDDEDDE